jgi:acetyl-CoA carboxylase biotin carboxyl carrier protein
MNNMDEILKLLNALAALPFDSVEVITSDVTVRVSNARAAGNASATPAAAAPPIPVPQPAASVAESSKLVDVASPIIGVFYRASSPEDEPYVNVGDRISAGQTLCVIEAMKLMNEVPSPISGILRQIVGQNASDVEVGQVLFRIEPVEGAK